MVEKMSVLHSSSPFCAHSTKQKAKYFCLLGSRFERTKTMQAGDQHVLVRTILCDEPTLLSYNFEDGILAAAWLQLISDMAQYEQNQI